VSTPLSWDEVSAGLVPARHSLFSVPERVAVRGDAMAELLRVKPDLARATERIEVLLRDSRRA
jgi:DNA primase